MRASVIQAVILCTVVGLLGGVICLALGLASVLTGAVDGRRQYIYRHAKEMLTKCLQHARKTAVRWTWVARSLLRTTSMCAARHLATVAA
jgi:hypothetical protein